MKFFRAQALLTDIVIVILCITLVVRANEMECTFFQNGDPPQYTCLVIDSKISKNDLVTISGEHIEGKNDSDVDFLTFRDSSVEKFPNGCFKKFPNIDSVAVFKSLLSEVVQENFKGATKLEVFFARSNNIVRLQEETFIEALNLEELNLGGNKLMFIHENAFKKLTELETLLLDQNWLKFLNSATFEDLVSLKKIHLDKNMIVSIPEGLFRNNLMLETILLEQNHIHTIFSDSFKNLKRLTSLDLTYNGCINIEFGDGEDMTALSAVKNEIKNCTIDKMLEAKFDSCTLKLKYKKLLHAKVL